MHERASKLRSVASLHQLECRRSSVRSTRLHESGIGERMERCERRLAGRPSRVLRQEGTGSLKLLTSKALRDHVYGHRISAFVHRRSYGQGPPLGNLRPRSRRGAYALRHRPGYVPQGRPHQASVPSLLTGMPVKVGPHQSHQSHPARSVKQLSWTCAAERSSRNATDGAP